MKVEEPSFILLLVTHWASADPSGEESVFLAKKKKKKKTSKQLLQNILMRRIYLSFSFLIIALYDFISGLGYPHSMN
jgi:hypothetical protein